jgi:hypothetical protein
MEQPWSTTQGYDESKKIARIHTLVPLCNAIFSLGFFKPLFLT